MKLFNFFTQPHFSAFFIGRGDGRTEQTRAMSASWRALVLSIATCYYLRLDSKYSKDGGVTVRNLRQEFLERFQQALSRLPRSALLSEVMQQARSASGGFRYPSI
jgi:hypothetical protein